MSFDVNMVDNKQLVLFHEYKTKMLLADALVEISALDLYPNITLTIPPKLPSEDYVEKMVSLLVELLEKWPQDKPLPYVSSAHRDSLFLLRKFIPNIPLGFLTDRVTKEQIDDIKALRNASVNCNYQKLEQPALDLAKNLEVPLFVYTVDDLIVAHALFRDEIISAVFSENAEILIPQNASCFLPAFEKLTLSNPESSSLRSSFSPRNSPC